MLLNELMISLVIDFDWLWLNFEDLGLLCLALLYWFCQVHFLLGLTEEFLDCLKNLVYGL